MPKICNNTPPRPFGELQNSKIIPVYECIEKLQATGGFVEVLGGPESGRTTLVKTAVGTMGSCPLIISGAPQEYAGLPRALNMPLLEPEVLMPAIREVLYRKTVDSLVFDTIHDLDTGGSVLNLLMKYFHTLMLPVKNQEIHLGCSPEHTTPLQNCRQYRHHKQLRAYLPHPYWRQQCPLHA